MAGDKLPPQIICYALLKLLFLIRLLYIVKHKDAGADEDKGNEKVYELYGAFLGKHKLCEKYTEYGGHEAEDRNLGNGIELKEHTPKSICDSGEEGEVYLWRNIRI